MISVVLNLAIVFISVGSWVTLARGTGDVRRLSQGGKDSLRYYTVLSNLLSAVASAIYLCSMAAGAAAATWVVMLKLAAATSVMVTFLTTAILLAPTLGWKAMYAGPNLWMHLVLPLLALFDVCLYVPVGKLPLWAPFVAVVPTALYAIVYVRMLLVHGVEQDGVVYDFYGFARWGINRIFVVAAVMLALTFVLALALSIVGSVMQMSW